MWPTLQYEYIYIYSVGRTLCYSLAYVSTTALHDSYNRYTAGRCDLLRKYLIVFGVFYAALQYEYIYIYSVGRTYVSGTALHYSSNTSNSGRYGLLRLCLIVCDVSLHCPAVWV